MNDFSLGMGTLNIVITWTIGMTPPILIRYVILRSPMEKLPAIGVAGTFLFINILIFTAMGSESKTHTVIWMMAFVSYAILRKKIKTVITINEIKEFDASIERDNNQKRESNQSNISEGIKSNSDQFKNLSKESYKQAGIALEYRQDAKLAFNSLTDVPKEFKHKFWHPSFSVYTS